MATYDLAVVGAGIIGLGHALAAAERGLRVVVIDRDIQANGASIRNFGLVVVSGQEPGLSRQRAERSREIWLGLSKQAGIDILHRGKLVVAQRPEAMAVLDAFASSPEAEGCRVLTARESVNFQPELAANNIVGGLYSPWELRIESREALPWIGSFLSECHGVEFRRGVAVSRILPPLLQTGSGDIRADKIVVCPGDDHTTLYPDRVAAYETHRCKLQMLRLADPGFRLNQALISDLSLLRYQAYAALPEAQALRSRLQIECGDALDNEVHLIVVQSADGSLVVGDSHHYGHVLDPFGLEDIDQMILGEFRKLFGRTPDVLARWTGSYSSARGHPAFIDAPHEHVRLVMVTSGTGASTGFALGEETITELFG
ncbi:TIGR03364 family FAD-dependent oxidoreductase [Mesorhizobium sp. VK24D]|uniref:TIGR03364 family FAD-dependent oxidoreductase n=1 Tax=Mesorhizobium album TaxID=3072314 RepID=A0ABU4Y3M4_9HYPH|nr:TIGR03364 family FAD-dependent oxidoreductase [Mesorhizobium sp. VK24D]MDX8481544.1 TIGR03364 family FAD-dependent oxidoreductase [Mesorhizobium sp. VK24D]